MSIFQSLILAAGRGSRLGALTDNLPKACVEIWGKPAIEWQLEILKECGIQDLAVMAGYKSHFFNKYHLKILKNNDWHSTNMLHSLLLADEWLKGKNSIITYGDVVYEKKVIDALMLSGEDIVIISNRKWRSLWGMRFSNPLLDAESFIFDQKSLYLQSIGKKNVEYSDIGGQYMGLLKFSPKGWDVFCSFSKNVSGVKNLSITEYIQILVDKDIKFKVINEDSKIYEIDTQEDLKLYSDRGPWFEY